MGKTAKNSARVYGGTSGGSNVHRPEVDDPFSLKLIKLTIDKTKEKQDTSLRIHKIIRTPANLATNMQNRLSQKLNLI